MLKIMGKKSFTILGLFFCFSKPVNMYCPYICRQNYERFNEFQKPGHEIKKSLFSNSAILFTPTSPTQRNFVDGHQITIAAKLFSVLTYGFRGENV